MPYKDKAKQLQYQRQHYQDNKEAYQDRAKKGRRAKIALVLKIKLQSCCIHCGERHPACLDFHHRPDEVKVTEVATMVREHFKDEDILAEIAKCDVVCANCHRKVHWNNYDELYKTEVRSSTRQLREPIPCQICGVSDGYMPMAGYCEAHWKERKKQKRVQRAARKRRNGLGRAREFGIKPSIN